MGDTEQNPRGGATGPCLSILSFRGGGTDEAGLGLVTPHSPGRAARERKGREKGAFRNLPVVEFILAVCRTRPL